MRFDGREGERVEKSERMRKRRRRSSV